MSLRPIQRLLSVHPLLRREVLLLGQEDECMLVGNWFSYFVQATLLVTIVSVVVVKWQLEAPRRSTAVFCLDASKQLFGICIVHVMNVVCSVLFTNETQVSDGTGAADECTWFWINVMLNNSVGVIVCYYLLRISEHFGGYESGQYDSADGAEVGSSRKFWLQYFSQLMVWCLIQAAMRAVMVVLLLEFTGAWEWLGVNCLALIVTSPELKLIFVMLVTPVLANAFSVTVQDQFLKATEKGKTMAEKMPLLVEAGKFDQTP